ncbi:MAG: hypothetical protein PVH00_02215 [Gemmatimonadota bacterium]|jgi:hypothetical protein
MLRRRIPVRSVHVLVVGLLVAACRGAVDDVDEDIVGPEIPGDSEAGEFATRALVAELDIVALNLLLPGAPTECMTREPEPPADSDADGVPDDARYTFSLEPCKTTFDDGGWVSNAGSIRVTDPGAAFGMNVYNDGYGYWSHYTEDGQPLTAGRVHTGTTQVAGSASAVSFSIDHDILYQVTGESDAMLAVGWTGTFSPSGAEPFPFHLVPGSLTLAGTAAFSRNGVTIALSLETVTPMRWVASCEAPWPVDGLLRAHVVSGGPSGYLEIRYSECWGMGAVEFIET